MDRLKHGRGKYTFKNGEYHEGSYYKDYRHGDGQYCWPMGPKFTGKFYLNSREGYGQQVFLNGATFQGLFHTDQRLGPGVVTYSDGCQDVGLWDGPLLLRFCSPLEEGFSLKDFPEYAAYMDPAAAPDALTQPPILSFPKTQADRDLLLMDENCIYPPGIERFSTNGELLPLPPRRRKVLDQQFFGELWEPDINPYLGYKRDPYADLPLQARLRGNIHTHRRLAEHVCWDVAAVLSMNRDGFGPKGILEVSSEQLIRHASRGELQAVTQILKARTVYPDVADSQDNTALIAATINNHHDVMRLLLNRGVHVDKLNCEGMSALAVCQVLFYPFHSLNTSMLESPQTQVLKNPSSCGSSSQISQVDFTTDPLALHNRPQTSNTTLSQHSDRSTDTEESVRRIHKEDEEVLEWNDCGAETAEEVQDEELTPEQSSDSTCSVSSSTLQDTQETAHKMAAMKIENDARLETLKILLERGANPNLSKVPMPVLFLPIMASDTDGVRRLLLYGARTDIPLPPERKGLYPLHVAAALPGKAGPQITELLFCAIPDPDAQACDQDDIFEPDKKAQETLSTDKQPRLNGGGRTALHVACQRDGDFQNASKVVALLLSHRASTHLLWSGHSPLSLAIASGNDQAVEELLLGGADPNLPLGREVGSALCAVSNINYHLCGDRLQLLNMLVKAGADFLMPVTVGGVVGTAVDFAYNSFNQDGRIANTPYLALKHRERETFIIRHRILSMMGNLLRQTAVRREKETLDREQQLTLNEPGAISSNKPPLRCEGRPHSEEKPRKPLFKFCYHCGRSASVKLTSCGRCHKVFFCSQACNLKAWKARHKDECVMVKASAVGSQSKVVVKPQGVDRMLTGTEKVQVKLKENYSYN
ncbi:ankyrin repeat and MYND domain-containing protein 1 [Hippoglossus stenolepis]|uniref:ankyrin repeat and MYND domain-containing protein 1 n=1 Tax=Hippoglossus stenolepis TaxID=195615 RepID=UPI00159C4F0B|nr:ankyrin repeat and MYND domain-containing protein 1 [Hippoglossus stenolepis]